MHRPVYFPELDPALVGLSLTYITSLIGMFQYAVRQSAEVENIVSVNYMSYGKITSVYMYYIYCMI